MSENVQADQEAGARSDPPAGSSSSASSQDQRWARYRLIRSIIWLLTGILEALIGIRVLLKLLGANPEAGFAVFIYGMTAVFLAPFEALFPAPSAGQAVLEISSLVAMLIYVLIAWGIVYTIRVIVEARSA